MPKQERSKKDEDAADDAEPRPGSAGTEHKSRSEGDEGMGNNPNSGSDRDESGTGPGGRAAGRSGGRGGNNPTRKK